MGTMLNRKETMNTTSAQLHEMAETAAALNAAGFGNCLADCIAHVITNRDMTPTPELCQSIRRLVAQYERTL